MENILDADPLPDELIIMELVLHIKDILSFHNSSTAVINHYVHPTTDRGSSNPDHNCHSSSSESRPPHPSSSEAHPVCDFRTRSDTHCICGRWGHSFVNCQQMKMILPV
jgi:hypothetical protein